MVNHSFEVLEGQDNYAPWHRDLIDQAYEQGVWQIINGTERILGKPMMPTPPDFSDPIYEIKTDDNEDAMRSKKEALKRALFRYTVDSVVFTHETKCFDEQRQRMLNARKLLFSTVSRPIRSLVSEVELASEAYKRIEELYKMHEILFANEAEQKLINITFSECDGIADLINQLGVCQARIERAGGSCSNDQLVRIIRRCLPSSYRFVLNFWSTNHSGSFEDQDLLNFYKSLLQEEASLQKPEHSL